MKKERIIYNTGDKIGECIFIKDVETKKLYHSDKIRWRRIGLFKCSCGKEFTTYIEHVKSLKTKSCGCLNMEKCKERLPPVKIKHGCTIKGNKSPEYSTWLGMKARCKDKLGINRKNYYEKGITVCDRWLNSFENFLEDMGKRPSNKYSLDRIDGNKGYFPENCRWATLKEQNGNKSSNVLITFNGKTQCLMYWAKEIGLSHSGLQDRLEKGMPIEKALTLPNRNKR